MYYNFLCDLFWFRRLPQQGNNKDDSLFLSEFYEFISTSKLASLFPDVAQAFKNWKNTQEVIDDNSQVILEFDVRQAKEIIGEESSNEILPLYIQNCNACIIIRMNKDNSAIVSVFTVHPKNAEIMSVTGDLLIAYPETSVKVQDKNSMLSSEEFISHLFDLFHNEISQIKEKSQKGKQEVVEDRNVVSSRIITEWLVAILGENKKDITTVEKKYRNSVEWKNAMYPYRRSGLWISMKAVLQLLLIWKFGEKQGRVYFKSLMIEYFIHIAEKYSNEMKDEMKKQVISKVAKRIDKLYKLNSPQSDSINSEIFTKAFKFISTRKEELDRNWKIIYEQNTEFNVSLKTASNIAHNTKQTLKNSEKDIETYLTLEQRQAILDEEVPSSIIKSFDISSFSTIKHSDGREECIGELFFIEEWVRSKMMEDNKSSPDNLYRLMVEYKRVGRNVYKDDPIGFSRMILTCLNIIRRLLEFAKKKSSFFSEYKTSIQLSIFNYLVLTTKNDFECAFELERYFKQYEQAALYDSGFSVLEHSFEVRYAKNNTEMQMLRRRLENEIEKRIIEKKEDVIRERERCEKYEYEARKREHDQFYNRRLQRFVHDKYCDKCDYEKKARELRVEPYEKQLPDEMDKKNAIVFELLIPDEFRCVRNSLIELAELDNRYDRDSKANPCTVEWKDYLSSYNSNNRLNRVSLTSSCKSFMNSHYSRQSYMYHPSSPFEDFIKNNALNLEYAIDKKYVTLKSQASIVDECAFSTSKDGMYESLNGYLKDYTHNQNMILSKQSECNLKLSISEFLEFGSFRAGYRLQMHNLAKVLSNNLLSFDQQDVCCLIIQSLFQTCPSTSDHLRRETNDPIGDDIFCLEFLSLLESFLKKVESNWKCVYQLTIVVFGAKKLLELSDDSKVVKRCEELLLSVRSISLEWLSKTNQSLIHIFDNKIESEIIRNLQIEIASCCCLTFHPERSILLKDLSKWLFARSVICENLLLNKIGVSSIPQFKKFLLRETYKTSFIIQDYICDRLNNDCQPLTDFLKEKWSESKEWTLKWKQYSNSKNWYRAETSNSECIIQVNVINGSLRINHAPIGRLPESITQTDEYQRVFKNMILDVLPGSQLNSFITKNSFNGSHFKFKTINAEDKILLITQITSENKELVYFPQTKFMGSDYDLPYDFIEDYSHWIDIERKFILFCPKYFLDANFSHVKFKLNLMNRLLTNEDYTINGAKNRTDNSIEKSFIDNKSILFDQLMKIMGRIEKSEHVHAYYNTDNTLIVELPRRGLTFILSNDYSHFACKQFGMKVETNFQIGTLIGLKKGIKLTDNEKTIILIPNGQVIATTDTRYHHVNVDIDLNIIQSSCSTYFAYTINSQLERLEAENSLSSWLYLAYLYGCTSHFLPDPFTKMCGYESALSILQSKRCYQLHIPMGEYEINLLENISNLSPERSFYPKHLKDMQQTNWNDLTASSSLVQLDSYLILCNDIQKNNSLYLSALGKKFGKSEKIEKQFYSSSLLYRKSYFKDLNYYSKDCEVTSLNESYFVAPIDWNNNHLNFKLESCVELYHSLESGKLYNISHDIISKISSIQRNSVNLETIESCLHLDIKDNFSILTHDILHFTKKKCMILLSMMMYFGYDQRLIQLLAFIYIHRKSVHLPSYPLHCSSISRDISKCNVEENEIRSILEKHVKPIGHFYSRYQQTDENENIYHSMINDDLSKLVTHLNNYYCVFKTSESDYLNHFNYSTKSIDNSYEKDIEKLFTERKENYQLRNYLLQLEEFIRTNKSGMNLITFYNPLTFNQVQTSISNKPQWKLSIDYSEQLETILNKEMIKKSEQIFETGQVNHDDTSTSNNIELLYNEFENTIERVLHPKSHSTNSLLYLSGLWPRITKTLILQLILNDSIIDKRLKNLVGSYGVLITLIQQSKRLKHLNQSNMSILYSKELENKGHENWKPSEHPHWLILEIEMNILIRPIQIRVANHLIHSQSNMVMQFNMGEGKTSVIIPMLILELGRIENNQLVRLTVLKSLLSTNYQSLRFKLGGEILNRPIIVTPFNRDTQVENSTILQQLYKQCKVDGGALLTVPEYRLSFELKCVELLSNVTQLNKNTIENDPRLQTSLSLFGIQKWLENNCRDLLDESDEILHVRYQLIYTIGNQLQVDGKDLRWKVLQQVFRTVKKYSALMLNEFGPSSIELKQHTGYGSEHSFPYLRIIESNAFEYLVNCIVNDLLDGKVKGIFIPIKTEYRSKLVDFLTCEEISSSTLQCLFTEYSKHDAHWKTLLILRGLLAYGTLKLVLSRRYRVNYGIGNNRLIAVPFRAKDVASERAEYGHADISILFTLLSYYHSGLSDSQLEFVFEKLKSLVDPEKEYSKWIEEFNLEKNLPADSCLNSLSNINLSDYQQKVKVVFPFFRKSMSVIDFYLNTCVFPKECFQFPNKLTSSSWNLCNEKKYTTSGFSGTKSFLLPVSIKSNELEELSETSKNVESHILRNEEYHVISNGQSCQDVIQSIVKCSSTQSNNNNNNNNTNTNNNNNNTNTNTIKVLLDVGALMLEMSNEELAKCWLNESSPSQIHAAVYFNENDELSVIDRFNHITKFDLSPYKNKLDQCVTYIDDIHTRGTDMKFPEGTRAAVTLGNGLSNERFVQACMRMRQLCSENGHSISFWASNEVDCAIRKIKNSNTTDSNSSNATTTTTTSTTTTTRNDNNTTTITTTTTTIITINNVESNNNIKTRDIVKWTHCNSKQIEKDHTLQWSLQGLIYSHKIWLHEGIEHLIHHEVSDYTTNNNINANSIDKLWMEFYEKYIEDEVLELQSFYGLERKKQLITQIFKLKEEHIRSLHHSHKTCEIFERNISYITKKLYENNMEIFTQALNEEQERELENELEEERQVDRPPLLDPVKPTLNEYLQSLVNGFESLTKMKLFTNFKNVKDLLSNTAAHNFPNIWNSDIYVTDSMKNVVENSLKSSQNRIDYYQRPIDWFIHFSELNIIVLICPYEANELFKKININGRRSGAKLCRFSRRIHIRDELLFDNHALCIPSTCSNNEISMMNQFLPDLFILSCSLYFKDESEQLRICNFLSLAPKPSLRERGF